jgi:hypothetical protein
VCICRRNTTEKQKYTTAIHFYLITENEIGERKHRKERKRRRKKNQLQLFVICLEIGDIFILIKMNYTCRKKKSNLSLLSNSIQKKNNNQYNCP